MKDHAGLCRESAVENKGDIQETDSMMVAQIRRGAQRVNIPGITSGCRATDGLHAKREREESRKTLLFSV